MDTFCMVRPEHLNHYGYLFGGMMLKWVDEFAWLVATREFPGCTLVTIAMDDILFKERVVCGAILRFDMRQLKIGKTSVKYGVEVYAEEPGDPSEKKVFTTSVTFVRVDKDGNKCDLPGN